MSDIDVKYFNTYVLTIRDHFNYILKELNKHRLFRKFKGLIISRTSLVEKDEYMVMSKKKMVLCITLDRRGKSIQLNINPDFINNNTLEWIIINLKQCCKKLELDKLEVIYQ